MLGQELHVSLVAIVGEQLDGCCSLMTWMKEVVQMKEKDLSRIRIDVFLL